MTSDLRRLVKILWRCAKYPSLYARQRNYKKIKKRNVYVVRVTFHPCAVLTPLNPQLPRCACGGPMGDIITHAQFQLNSFMGQEAMVTPNSLFPIHSDHNPYNSQHCRAYCDQNRHAGADWGDVTNKAAVDTESAFNRRFRVVQDQQLRAQSKKHIRRFLRTQLPCSVQKSLISVI